MSGDDHSATPLKNPTLTPKAIIHQKFGDKACYTVEEVEVSSANECPGLAIPQKTPCLFRCRLHLPDFCVVSDACRRKKEAEQSAAELALRKLGDDTNTSNAPVLDASEELVSRLKYLFSDQFLSKPNPLSSHMKAASRREGELNSLVPVSVLIALDTKLINLCKSMNPMVDVYPVLALPLIRRAVSSLLDFLVISNDQLWIRRQKPYPSELIESLSNDVTESENQWVEATYIPPSVNVPVQQVRVNIFSRAYYLDSIAHELGAPDASKIFISRTIGKASSEMRLYFLASETCSLDTLSDSPGLKDSVYDKKFNMRASFLFGQEVYGTAILASIGYTWRSADLFYEDVTLRTYFRLLVGKMPSGLYKLSRDSLLAAELPEVFTTRTHWRGLLPRELLCTLCRQYRLSEPTFSVMFESLEPAKETHESCKKLKVKDTNVEIDGNGTSVVANGKHAVVSEGKVRCEVTLFSKSQQLLLRCLPKESYKKQSDAVQNASLRVLSWLNVYFMQPDILSEKLTSFGATSGIHFEKSQFLKEFNLYQSIHDLWLKASPRRGSFLSHINQQSNIPRHDIEKLVIEGPETGAAPSNGSLACIKYNVFLVSEVEKHHLESSDEFEFEIGTGSVIPNIEAVVLQMVVEQSACLNSELPPHEFILAAANDPSKALPTLSTETCYLKYSISLLQITEPLEDRIEQALFSPPLSKQRLGFALRHIAESSATSLIDFGCGSGSLLDSLIDCKTSLETVVGVDLSRKGLIRAAKVLNSKLVRIDGVVPMSNVNSITLYEGSITTFDSRVYGFDIGTCLEVIEHMEEDQACLFGDMVLSSFCPKILIVSTPNYEYNVILQKHDLSKQEDDENDNSQLHSCKFRNHDHKFEWTREQFRRWATDLASSHAYTVEFDGVGGVAGVEPGFASQIAVFRRSNEEQINSVNPQHEYDILWEWQASS
ncbi:hypothetical protein V2J09_004696 [Rumex salicifolius]